LLPPQPTKIGMPAPRANIRYQYFRIFMGPSRSTPQVSRLNPEHRQLSLSSIKVPVHYLLQKLTPGLGSAPFQHPKLTQPSKTIVFKALFCF
jgi:hypothetical protein